MGEARLADAGGHPGSYVKTCKVVRLVRGLPGEVVFVWGTWEGL